MLYSQTFDANSMARIWQIMEGLNTPRPQKKQVMKEIMERMSDASPFLSLALCRVKKMQAIYNN